MPSPIQTGETQARLRRLLRVDAGLALSVDEVVVPVVVVGDASQPPYRTDGHGFISLPNVVAGVAGQFSYGIITGPPAGRLVVEGFVASASAAGTGSLFSAQAFAGAGAVTPADVESPQANATPYPGIGARVNALALATTPSGNELWRFELTTLFTTFHLPVPVVLPADLNIVGQAVQLCLRHNTVLTTLTFQWFGHVFEA